MIGREEENWLQLYAGLCENKKQPAVQYAPHLYILQTNLRIVSGKAAMELTGPQAITNPAI